MASIECTPSNFSVKRLLEVLAVILCCVMLFLGPGIGLLLTIYLLMYSSYSIYVFLYIVWIFLFDRNTCDEGGRRLRWFRNSRFWQYLIDYFPISLVISPGVHLDPKKNYMVCSFPHGVMPFASFCCSVMDNGEFNAFAPNFTIYGSILRFNFFVPFYRELILSLGLCSPSAKSIRWILSQPTPNVMGIMIGGAAEVMVSKPNQYHVVLKNRKGFVKIALETGASLIPIFSFGESSLYDVLDNPEGSVVRAIQEWTKKYTGFVPILPSTRALFQYSFGLIPKRIPITPVIGEPIDVQKTLNPTPEQISKLHQKFMDQLMALFEQHKHKYVNNSDEVKLIIS